jgi:hypothetical protein
MLETTCLLYVYDCYEISNNENGAYSWYGDISHATRTDYPWFARSTVYVNVSGDTFSRNSFRAVELTGTGL